MLDSLLSGPLGLVSEYSMLKEHGVENVYHLQSGRLDTTQRNIVYICRPEMIYMKYIAGTPLSPWQVAMTDAMPPLRRSYSYSQQGGRQ